jgi:hypothetical protein
MYKHALGAYRDISSDRPKNPLPMRYWRSFFYSAVEQDTKVGKLFWKHHKSAPLWLKDEVARFGPEKWLLYWDRTTGLPIGISLNKRTR